MYSLIKNSILDIVAMVGIIVMMFGFLLDCKIDYVWILASVLIIFFVRYSVFDNLRLYIRLMFSASLLGYFFYMDQNLRTLLFDFVKDVSLGMKVTIIAAAISLVLVCITEGIFDKKYSNRKYNLLPEQKEDLNGIKAFLKDFRLFGINGSWGTGKTFLLQRLAEDLEINQKFTFITINLLSCDLEKVELVVFKELDKLIAKNRIYSSVAGCYRDIYSCSDSYWSMFKTLFGLHEPALQDVLYEYGACIGKIEKSVVIVFEDIDRIAVSLDGARDSNGQNRLRQILSIGEFLTSISNNIKVAYTFDFYELQNRGLDWNYMEKYIPHVLNLTPIKTKLLLDYFLDNYSHSNSSQGTYRLTMKDFSFMYSPIAAACISKNFEKREISLDLSRCSIRKVKILLNDIQFMLSQNKECLADRKKKHILITLCVMRCFYYTIYGEICSLKRKPLDSFNFEMNDGEYCDIDALSKLSKLENCDEINKLFERQTVKSKIVCKFSSGNL